MLLLVLQLLLRDNQFALVFVIRSDVLHFDSLWFPIGKEQIYLVNDVVDLAAVPHLHLYQLELQIEYVF